MDEYSNLKCLWYSDDIATLREGGLVVPKQVHVNLSDLCNQDCHFCAYRMSNGFTNEQFPDEEGRRNPKRMIPTPKALEIVSDLAEVGVLAVQFTGGGEPTVHPDHLKVFALAQSLGLRTSLVTNGVIFRDGAEVVYPLMDWIRVSVDAGTAQTYAKVRNVPEVHFKKILENLKVMAAICQRPQTTLGVGYVVTRENWQELVTGAKVLQDTGAHNMRVTLMFSTDYMDYYGGLEHAIQDKIAEAKEAAPGFIIDLFDQRRGDLEQMQPDYEFCGYQQMCSYIGGDQRLYRCCSTAYTKHGEIADLRMQRYRDWFRSAMRLMAYKDFDARTCRVCQFNDKNRAINYMMKRPTHVEFV